MAHIDEARHRLCKGYCGLQEEAEEQCAVFHKAEEQMVSALFHADGKVFGVAAFEVFKVELYLAQVGFAVFGGHEIFFHSHFLFLIVKAQQNDGQFRLRSQYVEAQVPLRVGLAGTFGCERQAECLAVVGYLYQLGDECGSFSAVHGDATHPVAEDVVQRTNKPFFLHYEARFATYGSDEEFAEEEVEVAGVGSRADDTLVKVGHIDDAFPTHQLVEYETANFL